MLEGKVKIINPLGLHARAAAQLVRLASAFQSRVMLYRRDIGTEADAKSILSVLTLAASRGVELNIKVDGDDEREALSAVIEIFQKGFGEI